MIRTIALKDSSVVISQLGPAACGKLRFQIDNTERFRSSTSIARFDGSCFAWEMSPGTADRTLSVSLCREFGIDQLPMFAALAQERRYNAEMDAVISEYRRVQSSRPVTAEERFDLRAAFGPGEILVNALTGRKVRT